MACDPQMELRVSRLENDSNSIYRLITEIRSTQQERSQRLGEIDTTLAARFGEIDTTLTARFDRIETTLTEVGRRVPNPS